MQTHTQAAAAQAGTIAHWAAAKARLEGAASDAERTALCSDAAASLTAYMLAPAASVADLAQKLELFRDEALWDGWAEAEAISAVLAADARQLATSAKPAADLAFAGEWLSRWRAAGGWGDIGPDGRLSLGFPEAPDTTADSALPEAIRQARGSYDAGRHDARRCELLDALEAVPGGREAVKQLIAAETEARAAAGSPH